jgi:hypothetical protein
VALCCRLLEGLKVVKRSPYYRRLHSELQAPFPADAWHDDEWAFFVFELNDRGAKVVPQGSRLVVFAVEMESQMLREVKLITVDAYRKEASVEDLRGGEQYVVPLPPDW